MASEKIEFLGSGLTFTKKIDGTGVDISYGGEVIEDFDDIDAEEVMDFLISVFGFEQEDEE